MLYFITGSKNKFEEVKAILPEIEQLDMDLPEIQGIDAEKIIEYKLEEARKHHAGEFIVEDTGLYFDCLNGLPGPLIKWFMKTIGNEGLWKIAEKFENIKAEARTLFGYCDEKGNVQFFEGAIKGSIVAPQGENGFGWDPIFRPEGFNKTFAQISEDEKNKVSMRKIAVEKLKDYLKN